MPRLVSTSALDDEQDALVRRHLPLVRREARRYLGRIPPGIELDDLVAWGALGLLAALDRFDPARDTSLSTYARFRIRGAILDQLRRFDSIPRSLRDKASALRRVADALTARLGRPARDDELARGLGLSPAAYRALVGELAWAGVGSHEEERRRPHGDADGAASEPLAELLRRERFDLVAGAVRCLPDREQLVVSLYYRDDLTMREVGEALGVTESRVCQLHGQALRRLRAMLCEPEGGPQRPHAIAPAGSARSAGMTSCAKQRRLRSASAAGMPA